jgi:hypothetical protein
MRCRKAIKLIGPYIDGEMTASEAGTVRKHLETCEACSHRYTLMRDLVREVSSLPAIVPTPEESYRLMNRVRREMNVVPAPKPGFKRIQVAAAAISILVVATVASVAVAVWSGGGTTQEAEIAGTDGGAPGTPVDTQEETALRDLSVPGGFAAATAAIKPSLAVSEEEYDPAELEGFRNDLGTRLDFYSAYWYPASGSTIGQDTISQLQDALTEELAAQAGAAGKNGDELRLAVASTLEQAGDEPVIPCYAEYVKVGGRDAWLISLSGPEDYLLFPDAKRPPAMMLASLGGEESLKINESLLRELAALLGPDHRTTFSSTYPVVTNGAGPGEVGGEDAGAVPGELPGDSWEDGGATESDFQSFLRDLAARGTSLDVISALKGLNYEQILMLLHGDWASLAADGVNLSDFLTPPKRLWAVDCESKEVVWEAD